jgi:murein DD-endopeptidase MepM/ murein hydrolase activator NlpD
MGAFKTHLRQYCGPGIRPPGYSGSGQFGSGLIAQDISNGTNKKKEGGGTIGSYTLKGLPILIIMTVYLWWPGSGTAFSLPSIHLSSPGIYQGDLVLIKVELKGEERPRVWWMGQEIYLVQDDAKTGWFGFLGADLKTNPGRYPLLVKVLPGKWEKRMDVKVMKKDWGVRRLTLPKEMVELDQPTLQRVRKESEVMKEALDAPPTPPAWRGPFCKPVNGEVIGSFGKASIINGLPRAPHSGVDLRAERGTPVHAINNGKVVLVADQFFSGRCVVIDHGGAIESMYFHLEKVMVQEGAVVAKGQVIGLVGATGRAEGPHLHLGVRINGARVDPLDLLSISEQME